MSKYILLMLTMILIISISMACYRFIKYLKKFENELIEKHSKQIIHASNVILFLFIILHLVLFFIKYS